MNPLEQASNNSPAGQAPPGLGGPFGATFNRTAPTGHFIGGPGPPFMTGQRAGPALREKDSRPQLPAHLLLYQALTPLSSLDGFLALFPLSHRINPPRRNLQGRTHLVCGCGQSETTNKRGLTRTPRVGPPRTACRPPARARLPLWFLSNPPLCRSGPLQEPPPLPTAQGQ